MQRYRQNFAVFALAVAIFLPAEAVRAEIYTYILPSYPVESADCEDVALVWSETFAIASGLEVFSQDCTDSDDFERRGMDLHIYYFADEPVDNTVQQDLLFTGYPSAEDCQFDLAEQRLLFEGQTGLSSFAAYCSPAGYQYIHAFGRSSTKRFLFNESFHGAHGLADLWIEDPAALVTDIYTALSGLRIPVARISVDRDGAEIYYYATSRQHFEFVQYTQYADADDCQMETPSVKGMIEELTAGQVLTQFCAASQLFNHPQRESIAFVHYPDAFRIFQIYRSYLVEIPSSFASLDMCNAAREDLAARYAEGVGGTVYWSQCSLSRQLRDRYRVFVFRSTH